MPDQKNGRGRTPYKLTPFVFHGEDVDGLVTNCLRSEFGEESLTNSNGNITGLLRGHVIERCRGIEGISRTRPIEIEISEPSGPVKSVIVRTGPVCAVMAHGDMSPSDNGINEQIKKAYDAFGGERDFVAPRRIPRALGLIGATYELRKGDLRNAGTLIGGFTGDGAQGKQAASWGDYNANTLRCARKRRGEGYIFDMVAFISDRER